MKLFIAMLLLFTGSVFAAESGDIVKGILDFILPFLSKYPATGSVFMVIGVLRVIFKPLMAILKAVVDYTPYDKDNLIYDKVVSNKIFKAVAFVLDLVGSIKLPAPPVKK